jgi:diguanylate cyclase (GGDEF)-like protein
MSLNNEADLNERAIFQYNLDQLYRLMTPMLIANIVMALFTFWIYNSDHFRIETLYWLVMMVVVLILRAGVSVTYYARNKTHSPVTKWFYLYMLGTFLTGLTWGMTALLLMPGANESIVYASIVVIVGIATSAITSLGFSLRIYISYITPIIILVSLHLIFYRGQLTDLWLGLSFIPFAFFLVATARIYSSNLNSARRLHLEKETLVKQLQEKIESQFELEKELRYLSTVDSLTGCANRHHFVNESQSAFNRFQRYNRGLSIVVIDLDHFKQINDQYGHKVGDIVLVEFSKLCLGMLRSVDLFARVGGEEFCLLLEETDKAHTIEIANRIREMVAQMIVEISQDKIVQITCSIGCSMAKESDANIDIAYIRADRALYRAKANGRNQIEYIE